MAQMTIVTTVTLIDDTNICMELTGSRCKLHYEGDKPMFEGTIDAAIEQHRKLEGQLFEQGLIMANHGEGHFPRTEG